LRHRSDRQHLRPARARDHRLGQAGAVEPPAPRGCRGRRVHRRRGRNPVSTAPRVPGRGGRPAPHRPARPRPLRRGHGLPPPRDRSPPRLRGPAGRGRRGGRPERARLARRAHRRPLPGRDRPQRRAGHSPIVHRRRGARGRRVGAALVRGPQAGGAPRAGPPGRGGGRLLRPLDVLPHDRLQGDVLRPAVVRLLSRPGRRAPAHGPGDRPPALQHQHLPKLEARPPLPHDRPQRRDQHLAGQHQPASRVREDDALCGPGRGPLGAVPDHRAGGQRLGQLRQRDGAAGARRSLRPPRTDDDDPRGLRSPVSHQHGQAGVLRIPRGDPRALGRPGGHGLHGRAPGGRHPGPQRPAPLPLHGDHRRPGGAGQRGGRDRVPARKGPPERAPPAGQDVPRRYGGGPDRRGQRDQGQDRPAKALPPLAGREPDRAAGPVPAVARRPIAPGGPGRPAAGIRLHARGPGYDHRAHGPRRPGAGGLDGHGHAAGRALGSAQAAVQLLQAVVCPGDQPARRPAARRAGDVADDVYRQAAEPAGGDAGPLPPVEAHAPDPHQRRRPAPARVPARGFQGGHAPGRVSRRWQESRRGAAQGPGRSGGCGGPGDPGGGVSAGGERSRSRADQGPHPLPARHRGPASRPARAPRAERGGHRDRERRAARGHALLPAVRLRRQGDQSLPGLRGDLQAPARADPRAGRRARRALRPLHQRGQEGHPEDDVQDGHLDPAELPRGPAVRGRRAGPRAGRGVLLRHGLADRRGGPGHDRPRGLGASPRGLWTAPARVARARFRRRVPLSPGRRGPPLEPHHDHPPPARRDPQRPPGLRRVRQGGQRAEPAVVHAPRAVRVRARRARAPRRGRAGRLDREAVLHGGHVARIDQQRGPRGVGHCHEPAGGDVEHRRGGRRPGALPAGRQRRFAELRHQAGGQRPLRRDHRVPLQRPRAANQDGPGGQAGRGRPVARLQGHGGDRPAPPLDARGVAYLAAPAPRHLFH